MDPEEEIWEPNDFRCDKHGIYGSELPWPKSCTFCRYDRRIAELEAMIKSIQPDRDGNTTELAAPVNPMNGDLDGELITDEDITRVGARQNAVLVLSAFQKVAAAFHLNPEPKPFNQFIRRQVFSSPI